MSRRNPWIPHPDQRFVLTGLQGLNNDHAPDVRDMVRETSEERGQLDEETDNNNEETQETGIVSLVPDSDADQQTSDHVTSGSELAVSGSGHGSEVPAVSVISNRSGSEEEIMPQPRVRRHWRGQLPESSSGSSEAGHGRQASEPMSTIENDAENGEEKPPAALAPHMALPEQTILQAAGTQDNSLRHIAAQGLSEFHQVAPSTMGSRLSRQSLNQAAETTHDAPTRTAPSREFSDTFGALSSVAPRMTEAGNNGTERNHLSRGKLADLRPRARRIDYPAYVEQTHQEQLSNQWQHRRAQQQDRESGHNVPVQNVQRSRVAPRTAAPDAELLNQQHTRTYPSRTGMPQASRNEFGHPQTFATSPSGSFQHRRITYQEWQSQNSLPSSPALNPFGNPQNPALISQPHPAYVTERHPQFAGYYPPQPTTIPSVYGQAQAHYPPPTQQQHFGNTGYGENNQYQPQAFSPYVESSNTHSHRPQNDNESFGAYTYNDMANDHPELMMPPAARQRASSRVPGQQQPWNNIPTATGFNRLERPNSINQLFDWGTGEFVDEYDASAGIPRQNRKRKTRDFLSEDEGNDEADYGEQEEEGDYEDLEANSDIGGEEAGLPDDGHLTLTPSNNPQTTGVVTNENDGEPGRGFAGKAKFWCRIHRTNGFQIRPGNSTGWRKAIRHDDIRENLLADAHARCRFRFPRKRGSSRLDITSCTPEQQNWDFDNRNTWPDIMFRFEKTSWQGHHDSTLREPQGEWMWRDRVIVDRDNRPLRKFNLLNDCCSSVFEGATMEYLSRMCPKIEPRDIWGRTPDVGRVPPTAQAYNTRKSRFREKNGMIAWRVRDGTEKFREATREKIKNWGRANNSTKYFTGFNPEEMKKIEEKNKNSKSSQKKSATHQRRRAAKEAAEKDAKEGSAEKEEKKQEQEEAKEQQEEEEGLWEEDFEEQ